MMGGTVTILILLFGSISSSPTQNEKPPPSPCHDFYDYVCTLKKTAIDKLYQPVPQQYNEIDQFQEYHFRPGFGRRNLFDAINKTEISEWIVEYETLKNGVEWEAHVKKHETFLILTPGEQEKSLMEVMENDSFSIDHITIYYSRLKNAVTILKGLSLPENKKQAFYHKFYTELQSRLQNNIDKYSTYTQEQKNLLKKKLNDTKVMFSMFDYNNIGKWEEAKKVYEKRYFQLKQDIVPSQMNTSVAEKLIRMAAVEDSVKVLQEYMKEFSKRFIFQTVIAASTNDCFNYLQEIHVSIVTRINPQKDKDAVFTDTLFALTHELYHSIYNLEDPTFEIDNWKNERKCVDDRLTYMAETDNQNVTGDWNFHVYTYEDIANIEAVRSVMQLSFIKSESDFKKRQRLERLLMPLCSDNKNRIVSHHNPTGVSLNVAISELPNFSHLYNCSDGDRMHVAPQKICSSLAMKNNFELYNLPNPIFEEVTSTIEPETSPITDLKNEEDTLFEEVSIDRTSENYSSSSSALKHLISIAFIVFFNH